MPDEPIHPNPDVVEWLNRLRPEDVEAMTALNNLVIAAGDGDTERGIKRIQYGLSLVRSIEGAGRVARWIVVTVGGAVMAFAAFPDQVRTLLKAWGLR